MKLYYDMYVPFMPDSRVNESGELVKDENKLAGRQAMVELSNFQRDGNIVHLYNAVLQSCIYMHLDVIDTITNIPEDLEIPSVSIEQAVEMCAKMLIRSVNPNNEFDINKFVGILLTASHFAIEAINNEREAKASEVKTEA